MSVVHILLRKIAAVDKMSINNNSMYNEFVCCGKRYWRGNDGNILSPSPATAYSYANAGCCRYDYISIVSMLMPMKLTISAELTNDWTNQFKNNALLYQAFKYCSVAIQMWNSIKWCVCVHHIMVTLVHNIATNDGPTWRLLLLKLKLNWIFSF